MTEYPDRGREAQVTTCSDREKRIEALEYDLLLTQSRSGVIGAALSSVVLVLALRDVVPVVYLGSWLTAYLLLQVPRLVVLRSYFKVAPDDRHDATGMSKLFVLLTIISGGFWGSAGVVLFPSDSLAHQCLLAIFIAGIASAAASTYSARIECFVPTILMELIPPAGRFFYQNDEQSVIVGAVVLLFAGVLILTARLMNHATGENIRLGLEKDDLIASLSLEKSKVADLNGQLRDEIEEKSRTQLELEQSHTRLEEIVQVRTAELSDANKRLHEEIAERIRAEELARREKQNLVDLFEAMEDGVHVVDTEYNLRYVNKSIRQDFGPPDGRKCYEYFHDASGPCSRCHLSEVPERKSARFEWYSSKTGKTYEIKARTSEGPRTQHRSWRYSVT